MGLFRALVALGSRRARIDQTIENVINVFSGKHAKVDPYCFRLYKTCETFFRLGVNPYQMGGLPPSICGLYSCLPPSQGVSALAIHLSASMFPDYFNDPSNGDIHKRYENLVKDLLKFAYEWDWAELETRFAKHNGIDPENPWVNGYDFRVGIDSCNAIIDSDKRIGILKNIDLGFDLEKWKDVKHVSEVVARQKKKADDNNRIEATE